MTRVAVLGLGEAGRIYGLGLSERATRVVGFDPYARVDDRRVHRARSVEAAVDGADLVISLVGAAAARDVARGALAVMKDGVYADFNTASPETKSEIEVMARGTSVLVTDVAVLAPVPRSGVRTPLLASGPGAERFAALAGELGMPADRVEGPAGAAARMKLLRSVFMKGLAALVLESLTAARAAGSESWLRTQIGVEFGPEGETLVERLVVGTVRHGARRLHEVRDALAGLEALGTPTDVTRATVTWLERVVAENEEA